jgi:ABC-type uncharacterized transport system permease subunit
MIRVDWNPTSRNLRQFAWACPVGFTLVGLMLRRFGAATWCPWAGLGFGLALLAIGLARPKSLRSLYVGIMLLGAPIGWIVSSVLAAVFFFLVITPLGLFFRLIGRDPLYLRARGMPTYWREHRAAEDPRSYYRQG